MAEQLPPRRDSLTPTSYLLLNFLLCSLINWGMYGNNYSPILGPGIPVITLDCVEKHLARGEYPVSTPRRPCFEFEASMLARRIVGPFGQHRALNLSA